MVGSYLQRKIFILTFLFLFSVKKMKLTFSKLDVDLNLGMLCNNE